MRSLFLKIFLWFWGAMVLIGLTVFLVVTTTLPDPLPQPWRESTGAVLAAYATAAATAWEAGDRTSVDLYLREREFKSHARLQLFDDADHALSEGREPRWRRRSPDGSARADETPERRQWGGPWSFGRPQELPSSAKWQSLRQRALRSDEAVFELAGPRVLAAQSVKIQSGRRYVIQAVLPWPRFGRPAADPRAQWLGVLVVLGVSGLVCYGLVRYLTAPMLSLRAATQRLAAGDLAARTGAAQRRRRDEVADLGRDFDSMAERIQALVMTQRQLLGDISHELRSPLARLTMALALARRHVAQGTSVEETNAALDRIKRETGRLNELIEQLLQLTRLESGEVRTDPDPVELEQLVREVVTDADFEARESNRAVQVTQTQPCQVTGSGDLLRSAVENVVRNAVRYTSPGSTVEVSLLCRNEGLNKTNTAIISVRDHGEGVPEETLNDLFRPFYRVADARDRESGGVGLGLAITERAVRSHGGTVSAQNVPDGGLLVELRLPVTQPNNP